MKKKDEALDLNRRDFLKGGSLTTLMLMMGGVACRAADKPVADGAKAEAKPAIPPTSCAVIGCGIWGREILTTLAAMPGAAVVGMCDTYKPFLNRSKKLAPRAELYEGYHQVLGQKDIKAVIIATPSHQHREIAIAALQAGKHVYCEAPLATTLEDARAIAQAAKAAGKQYFQAGLQARSDPQRKGLIDFVRTAMGKTVQVRSQYHKKESWRRSSPNPEQEKVLNWRLNSDTSIGLMGEIGVHAADVATWYLRNRPVAVTGFGSLINWKDGRDVNDTVQTVFEYPGGINFIYDCSLATSFDSEYELLYGTDCTIMWRERHAWMFKEVDSPLLGWEVYAKKETFYKESGIVLDANATKQAKAVTKKQTEETVADPVTPLQHALESFLTNANTIGGGVEDFTTNFGGGDAAALKEYLAGLAKDMQPAAGYKDGYEATVTAIKANEATRHNQRIAFSNEWFELA